MRQQLFKDKDFNKKLIMLVLPIAFQQFMLSLVSACDAVMLGAIGQDSLSAVSLAGQITFVYNLFLAAMTIGTGIFAAQYWGKGDKAAVERVLGYVLKISAVVSIGFFLATVAVPTLLMRIFTSDGTLIGFGAQYLRIVGLSYLLCGVSQIYLCIMKNSQLAGRCMVISSVTVVLNIVLNAVFIYGLLGMPKMGIAGAAVATVISRGVELLWAILESLKKDRIKMRPGFILHTDQRIRRDFWKYTLPVLGNELVWGVGFTMYSVIMGHLGTDAVAANAIANIVKNLIACFCIGLGSGGGIMVGNELGAARLQNARVYGRRVCILAIVSGAATGLVIVLLTPLILHFSNLSPQANLYLKWMLLMCAYYMIGKSVNSTTIGGIFCAGGDSKFGFLCDTVTMWCIVVPLGLVAAFVLKLPVLAVYFIINLDELMKLPVVYKHYVKYKWVRNLTVSDE